jgi:cell division transport system permease protein
VASLTAALTLCGVFLLLDHNVRQALHQVGDRRELVVYLKDSVSESQLATLTDKMRQYFGEPTYVSRKQAWAEFSEQIADPELLSGVEDNPLPASLHVRLKPELLNLAAMEQAARQVREFDEVEDVRYGAEYVGRFNRLSAGLRLATIAVGVLVVLAIVLVLYNALRLTVLARRSQVEIMLRLGASNRFIATPFVFEALLQTAIAAGGAMLLVFALQQGVATHLDRTHVPAVDVGARLRRRGRGRGVGRGRRRAVAHPADNRGMTMRRLAILGCTVLLALGLVPGTPSAQDSLETAKRRELEAIRREAQEKRAQAGALRGQENRALGELKKTERQLAVTRKRLRDLRVRRDRLDQQLDVNRANLQRSVESLQAQRHKLAHRLRRMYMTGPAREIEYLVSTRSFGELLMRWDFLQMVAASDRLLLENVRSEKEQVEAHQTVLEENLQEVSRTAKKATVESTKLTGPTTEARRDRAPDPIEARGLRGRRRRARTQRARAGRTARASRATAQGRGREGQGRGP